MAATDFRRQPLIFRDYGRLFSETGRILRNFPEPPTIGIFSKVSPVQMGGALRYKYETYCSTNWRCIVAFPCLQGLEASEARLYKWGVYCGTNWRCTTSTFQASCTGWGFLNSAQNMVSESTASNTELTEFFGSRRVLGEELSEFRTQCVLSSEQVLSKQYSARFPFSAPPQGQQLLFESKLLPAVLLVLRIYFPQITVAVTVLKFG